MTWYARALFLQKAALLCMRSSDTFLKRMKNVFLPLRSAAIYARRTHHQCPSFAGCALWRYIYENKNAKRTKCDSYQGIYIQYSPMINSVATIRSFDINLLIQIWRRPMAVPTPSANCSCEAICTVHKTTPTHRFSPVDGTGYVQCVYTANGASYVCVAWSGHKQKYSCLVHHRPLSLPHTHTNRSTSTTRMQWIDGQYHFLLVAVALRVCNKGLLLHDTRHDILDNRMMVPSVTRIHPQCHRRRCYAMITRASFPPRRFCVN